jgi:2-isopropylmalate synthase
MTESRPTGPGHSGGDSPSAQLKLWKLNRIDLRSPVSDGAWPVARVELEHPARGRVTDIGSAPGAFDACFAAASHILDIAPRLLSYEVRSDPAIAGEALGIRIDVALEMGGRRFGGTSSGVDLVRCSLEAWLDAASKALA